MRRFTAVMMTAALLLAGLCAAAAWAQERKAGSLHLRFSTWHPPASREVKTVWVPMLEELKKRSQGRITYTLYAGGALGSGPEHYDIVRKGLADMGYFTATWTPGRFPLADALSLATWVEGKDVAARIGNELLHQDQALAREFAGVKVLELNGCIQAFIWTKKPVRTLEDLKGLKVRSPGGHQTNYIKALGAEPVFMPLGEVYMAMETGAIDGIVTCTPLVLAFKLHEVARHGVVATFGCVTEGVVMNQKTWDKTPEDLKPIIMEVVGNPFAATEGLTQRSYQEMIAEIKAKGVELYRLPQAEQDRWYARFQEETRRWVGQLQAKGLASADTVRLYNQIAEQHGVVCPAYPPDWPK